MSAITEISAIQGRTFTKVLLLVACLIPGCVILADYFILDYNLLLGLLCIPFLPKFQKAKSYRWNWIAVFVLASAFIIPVKTTFFLALLFITFSVIETQYGKLNNLIFILVFLMSPIFHYISKTIGFPLRMTLTHIAGKILEFSGRSVHINGSEIQMGADVFSVDPACAGLNMLTTSLICGVFFMLFAEWKYQKKLSIGMTISIFFLIVALNIGSNLIRILSLITFSIPPEDSMHDICGMVCQILYVGLPSWLIINHIFKIKRKEEEKVINDNFHKIYSSYISICLLVALYALGFTIENKTIEPLQVTLQDFQNTSLPAQVQKLENKEALIYIKPLEGFYSAEHNPMVCWQGSGYHFEKITSKKYGDMEIYTGVLKKDADKLYAAWWFDDGKLKTIEQWKWRWSAFKEGKKFSLVNVNCPTQEKLDQYVNKLMGEQIFKHSTQL